MCELGKNSKNYCRMRDLSFWKSHEELKDEINKKHHGISRKSRKKLKRNPHVPKGLTHSSTRLRISLCVLTRGFPFGTSMANGVSYSEVFLARGKQ